MKRVLIKKEIIECCTDESPPRLILADRKENEVYFPDWCPLEPYPEGDVSFEPAVDSATGGGTGTGGIVLIGMPTIEWAPDNLTGYGGTEVDGLWYYTWEQAMNAAAKIGDGWRLPTLDELEALVKLGCEWDDDRKGCVFGGKLFLPASGFRGRSFGLVSNVCSGGYYWSSSPHSREYENAGRLYFDAASVNPLSDSNRAHGFTVRCVREL